MLNNAISFTYYVEISKDNNAPLLSQIVQDGSVSPSPPTYSLQSFNTIEPIDVKYLIDERATGNLKSIMDSHPLWSLSRLQQYIVVIYDESQSRQDIETSFAVDPYIKNYNEVSIIDRPPISTYQGISKINKEYFPQKNYLKNSIKSVNAINENIQSAWELSEGMGYIGSVDTGIEVNHPSLRAFDEDGNYTGGNLLDGYYHIDTAESLYDPVTGDIVFADLNIDSFQPIDEAYITSGNGDCDFTDGVSNDDMVSASFIGHGSHVAGLLAAKGGLAPGICKNCGLSMMKYLSPKWGGCWKYTDPNNPNHTETYQFSSSGNSSFTNGLYYSALGGVGVLNFSGGGFRSNPRPCPESSVAPSCLQLRNLDKRQIMFVASAGNDRRALNFPASDPRVVAVGGLTEEITSQTHYWNDHPNGSNYLDFDGTSNCFRYHEDTLLGSTPNGNECGSNHSFLPDNYSQYLDHKTDVMIQARNVKSTFYQGKIWSPSFPNECSDGIDGQINDGYGLCTGTSMSAPQVSAMYQLMRSAHPLLPNGSASPDTLTGLRNVMNATTDKINGQTSFSEYFGYGTPNVRKALEVILGKSNGIQIKTRLTPMFDVVAIDGSNNAYSAFPQTMTSFLLTNAGYIPNANVPLVNEFTEFWYDNNIDNPDPNAIEVELDDPRAAFYVFSTNNNPFSGTKNMVPLRRMEKSIGANRNDTYAVSDAEIQSFHNDNYNYAGIEGYILPISQCSPNPCTSAIALYRDESDPMNHKLVPTNTAPPTSTLLGYVYLNQDTDGDGLIDGQEIILGTNINNIDSDGDTVPDGVEYPAAGVPYSDPMVNDIIFKHGFEI